MTAHETRPLLPPPQLLELGSGRRLTLRVGHHDRYLASEEPDGTIVLRPAVVMTQDERALLAAPWLVEQIDKNMADPAMGTRRELPNFKD